MACSVICSFLAQSASDQPSRSRRCNSSLSACDQDLAVRAVDEYKCSLWPVHCLSQMASRIEGSHLEDLIKRDDTAARVLTKHHMIRAKVLSLRVLILLRERIDESPSWPSRASKRSWDAESPKKATNEIEEYFGLQLRPVHCYAWPS